MKTANTTLLEERTDAPQRTARAQSNPTINDGILTLPLGLLGFEKATRYVLLGKPDEAPFLWLQMEDDAKLAFLVIEPSVVLDSYNPDLTDEDVKFLGLKAGKDALVFNIVTVHADGSATVNLKGPIVVNAKTRRGKQVVPMNASEYDLRHPVPVVARDTAAEKQLQP